MGQKQLPAIDVKRAAERHNGRSHAERLSFPKKCKHAI
jgi:hypothetical protein